MLKLRTMKPTWDADRTATVENDPRITPLGRFLRRSHIDELPQIWNILLGHMTLIGPGLNNLHSSKYTGKSCLTTKRGTR